MKYIAFILLSIFITSCGADPFKQKTASPQSSSLSSSSSSNTESAVGTTQNCICTMDYTPVCGVNDKTYSNACTATCAGISEFSLGECSK